MWPQAPFHKYSYIQAYHIIAPDFYVFVTILMKFCVFFQTVRNKLIPILDLRRIFISHHILGTERNDLLKSNDEHIWLVALIEWEQPFGEVLSV